MSLTEDELAQLVGRELPGDSFKVEGYEDWLLRDVVLADPADDAALHPLWAFVASVRSMGITLEALFELCGTSSADGPLFAGCRIHWDRLPVVDQQYRVCARIDSAVRKQGRRAGTFDLVGVGFELLDLEGALLLTVHDSYVFPHRTAA